MSRNVFIFITILMVGLVPFSVLVPGEKITFRPQPIEAPLRNPFKGYVPWIGDFNMHHLSTMQYKTFSWKPIEPQEGVYNWTWFEAHWDRLWHMEMRVGIRISTATPGSAGHIDVPQWLVDLGVPMRDYDIDGDKGKAPDWDHPVFLEKHLNFIQALGARYNNDPRIAWVDIGSYGFWGEWHVWLNEHLAATDSTKKKILAAYFTAFPNKRLVIAFDDEFATQYVTDRGEGIRNDCLGTAAENNWYLTSLNRIDPTLNDRAWKQAIITGEFCGSDRGALAGTTERFSLNLNFIKQTHWSFIGTAGGNIPPQDSSHQANLDLLHKTLGYRYIIRSFSYDAKVRQGDTLALTIAWDNVGIAPFCYPWPIVIYLVDANGATTYRHVLAQDLRALLPGMAIINESIPIPANLPAASYDLRLGIEDPDLKKPAVQLAIEGKDDSCRYSSGRVTIIPASTGINWPENPRTKTPFDLHIYSNPASIRTEFQYYLPEFCRVNARIFNIAGQEVTTLANEVKAQGTHLSAWNTSNFASSIYFVRIQVGDDYLVKKFLVLR